jgi:hypothetical protein
MESILHWLGENGAHAFESIRKLWERGFAVQEGDIAPPPMQISLPSFPSIISLLPTNDAVIPAQAFDNIIP